MGDRRSAAYAERGPGAFTCEKPVTRSHIVGMRKIDPAMMDVTGVSSGPSICSSAPVCDKLKRGPIRDADRCSLDLHPTRPLPFVQTLVDAFSCRANDIAQFTLRHMNPFSGAAERLDIAHPEQRLRKLY